MTKPSRTYGPIHFEDLDPHRFEDLIRELIYDYNSKQLGEAVVTKDLIFARMSVSQCRQRIRKTTRVKAILTR